ncbi:MAG: prolyl oligopeptidase family serine peptidase [Phycisphaerae bacterium]|nr:prolyl oligopeptidase family serine peptidase [Phycisphaerae bacterium]
MARIPGPSGDIPILVAHPDWKAPAPVVVWLHGRTAHKELDPGRYLRWIRAGMGACAMDLPAHGERSDVGRQDPSQSLDTIARAAGEIDAVVTGLNDPAWSGMFDLGRLAIGGMSLGGMAALLRLCEPHRFRAASVEGSAGWLEGLYVPGALPVPEQGDGEGRVPVSGAPATHDPAAVRRVDPVAHLEGFVPIPLLVLHSEADRIVPWLVQRRFVERLRSHYRARGADESMIEVRTWASTGAPLEHVGFGRFSNDAKNTQAEFLARALGVGRESIAGGRAGAEA